MNRWLHEKGPDPGQVVRPGTRLCCWYCEVTERKRERERERERRERKGEVEKRGSFTWRER